MIDTDTCVALLRKRPAITLQRFAGANPSELFISSIVVAELRFGADKCPDSIKNHMSIDDLLTQIKSLPFDDLAATWFGTIRADLAARGRPIGPFDMLIAAHAQSLGLILVTHNTKDFSRIPGLKLEDWQV